MNRKSLLDTLELVKPGLSDDGLVPIFTNFCFLDGEVYAFKDKLGIIAPCQVEGQFAVQGKTFIELLKASSAKEVELKLDNDHVHLVAGKSRMKLPYMGKSEFIFEEPEDEQWEMIFDLDDHLLRGIELCLTTTTNDNTMPAFMGITVKGGKVCHLYSCDGDALSKYRLDGASKADVQRVIPNEFCDAILRIGEKTGFKAGQLYINGEWALAEFGNNFKVYGRIIEVDEPFEFEDQMKKAMKVSSVDYVTIPDALTSALSRARVLADPESKATTLKVEGGKLKLHTETHAGVVVDSMKLEGHGDVEVTVNAKLIHRAIATCDEFAILENCTMYKYGDDLVQLVANYNEG